MFIVVHIYFLNWLCLNILVILSSQWFTVQLQDIDDAAILRYISSY